MKTLFCDLDNTLLFPLEDGSYGIKECDLSVLKTVLGKEVQLVIASGRPAEIKEAISKMLGHEVDAIGFNGQQIISSRYSQILASFPVSDYLEITDFMQKHYPQTSCGTTDFDGIYYLNEPDKLQPMKRFKDHHQAKIIKGICELPFKQAVQQYNIKEVAKLLIYLDPSEDDQPILKDLRTQFGDRYDFIRSNSMFIEGLCKNFSKRSGIEAYIQLHDLNIKDCYCAGDADNDIEMFELFKDHSYCMKEGTANALAKAAHHVDHLYEIIHIITKEAE